MGCCELCPRPGSHSELVSQGQGGRRTALTRLSCNSSKKQACLRNPAARKGRRGRQAAEAFQPLTAGPEGKQPGRETGRGGGISQPTELDLITAEKSQGSKTTQFLGVGAGERQSGEGCWWLPAAQDTPSAPRASLDCSHLTSL